MFSLFSIIKTLISISKTFTGNINMQRVFWLLLAFYFKKWYKKPKCKRFLTSLIIGLLKVIFKTTFRDLIFVTFLQLFLANDENRSYK